MKILFVNELCGFFGGVEQNIYDTVLGLKERGHKCFLAYGQITTRNVETYKSCFDDCFLTRNLPGNDMDEKSYSFDEIGKSLKPDVLYYHKVPEIHLNLNSFSEAGKMRMVHDHDLCCPRRHKYYTFNNRVCDKKAGLNCWLDGAFLKRDSSKPAGFSWNSIRGNMREMRRNYHLDTILAGSRFMKEELIMNGFPEEKVFILPPVVNLNPDSPEPVPDENNILYVGQLIKGKGVDLLLDALRKLTCGFNMTIIGAGNAMNSLKTQTKKLELEENVNFTGWVNNEVLDKYYKASKLVVVPSRWPEPFGMVGLEAMSRGRAVVGFDVGGIPDWLVHNVTGLLVHQQDIDKMAESIEKILNENNLADRFGKNGFNRFKEKYSFETYLGKLESYLFMSSELKQ